MMLTHRIPALLSLLALAACGAQERLIAKPARVPPGTDMSGQWLLRATEGTSLPAARETLVYVFLETGRSVKITQTASGLFVSFDRSVVEEYRFGEHREISVGEVSAERVSGWEGRSYVIETLDRNGTRLIDSYALDDDRSVLRRHIVIQAGDRVQLDLAQVFDRV
jgi:hypothetical protein